MDDAMSRHYFSNAWRSLKTTHNLFGKLCLLTLIQVVPILGQIVALGYFLGWAREGAWGMNTPLPAHVFGRDDPGFWARGAKAFAIQILYGLIVGAFVSVLTGVWYLVVAAFGLVDAPFIVFTSIMAFVTFAVALLFAFVEIIGLIRMAIYDRFGAAFQWGVCFKMLFHFFGSYIKVLFTAIVADIVLSILVAVVAVSMVPGIVASTFMGLLAASFVAIDDSVTISMDMLSAFVGCLAVIGLATTIACFLLDVITMMVEALIWRCFGNLIARFDVPAWGGRFDKLPYETGAYSAPSAPEPAGEPVKRCHPLCIGLLGTLVAALLCAGTSLLSLEVFATTCGEDLTREDVEAVFDRLAEEFQTSVDTFGSNIEDILLSDEVRVLLTDDELRALEDALRQV